MKILSFSDFLREIGKSRPVSASVSAFVNENFTVEIAGCEGAFGAMLLAKLYAVKPGLYCVVAAQETDAADLALDLAALGLGGNCLQFPWWGTAPYRERGLNGDPVLDGGRASSAVFGERVKALSDLVLGKPGIVIIPERAFLTPLPPPEYVKSLLISIKPGGKIDTTALSQTLVSYGYIRVPKAQVPGEFALRGEVLDIFMGGGGAAADAFRILFDFDQVESVKRFDPFTQSAPGGAPGGGRDREKLPELLIHPMKEVVWTDERIETLGNNLAACNEFTNGGNAIIEELITRRVIAGEEMFYPLAFNCTAGFLDYLGAGGTLVLFDRERLENAQDSLNREYRSLYSRSRRDAVYEYPLPERLLFDFRALIEGHKRVISFKNIKSEPKPDVCHIDAHCEPARSFFGNINYLKEEFAALHASGWHIAVAAESEVQAERIRVILAPDDLLSVMASPLSAGFALPELKLMLVQENEIFGRRKRPPRSLKTARSSPIDTFVELNPGDYVVHVNHGIGLFKGIERINTFGYERDYIQLEYAGDETVFVPVEQVNLVQRYIGNEGQPPRLDTVGSKSWESRKRRVKESVEDIARQLIELYSKRKRSQGFAFPRDSEWQTMFEAAFPFEETEDQLRCVEEIKQDMESSIPMDRLVCGDVGYGKTEVAVRACFKAIMGGKQAAFLAPTTILAEQHYENFLERFSHFPVRIAMLSRFVDRKRTKAVLEQVKKGEIDLLVGTHRIIQKDVAFKNLGLMVIDEEQRFGVKDKERLKELKTNVDCLTLSATPIPRTLHMSLLKIRDMSLLSSPPPGRHPIETVIEEYNDERLVQAIRGEVGRGGQVFFLHNRIETLRETRIKIEHLVPEMLVET
ncbi:MAG: DEAD/DEAH box helicase, partial [Treponema sp.]|nr:DEAD/DEAH box helicase [Treponema sp.]